MMPDALIGHTGFVGGNLARQMHFDEFYNSKNIEEIRGREFDTVVCAGMPGAKWYANQHRDEDRDTLVRLFNALFEIRSDRLVLISTVDAASPRGWYGLHREWLERASVPNHIIRLPALFGPGLKKNALYDLMHGQRLDAIAPNAIYQWYPLRRLGEDIGRIREKGIRTINLVSESIAMEEVRARFFPNRTIGPAREDAAHYNVPCEHPEFWLSKGEIMDEMGRFLAGATKWKCARSIPTG